MLPYRFPALRLNRLCLIVATTVFTGSLLVGCGSSGVPMPPPASTVTTGRAALTIRWPERDATRLIPFAANSIRVRLTSLDGTRSFGETLLVRPTNGGTASATFSLLPTGPCLVVASAYPGADGSGVAQAAGQTQAEIVANQTAEVRLTLASTIAQITLTPATATLSAGQSNSVTTSATNAAGEVVLTAPSNLSWESQNPAIATVQPTGVVTAVSPGNTTVTVTEIESGKVGTLTVSVPNPNAASNIYDGFDYSPPGAQITGQNGGAGWTAPWTASGPGTPSIIVSGSLTFGKLVVLGNSFKTTSFNPRGDERLWNAMTTAPGTVRYFSVLVRPESLSGGFPGPYFGFGVGDRFFGKSSDQPTLVIERGGNGEFVSTGIVPQANTTYFFVVRVTYGPTNDTYDFWVNPTPGQPLPTVPSASQVRPHDPNDDTGHGFSASVPCIFDELRFGPTWESVSPTTP